jgi:presenilin-like A22 family membrane protease
MSQDRNSDSFLSAMQGLGMIVIGTILVIAAAVYNDNYSWQGYLLAGISFVLGVCMLVCALRTNPPVT